MKNVVHVASFFFPLHFRQLSCHYFFFPLIFGNATATIGFHFGHSPSMHFRHFMGRTRISVISLPKFNFLSLLTHGTFSCNFENTVVEIQSLSSFFQITLNNTYNSNKLRFFAIFSQKTLVLIIWKLIKYNFNSDFWIMIIENKN